MGPFLGFSMLVSGKVGGLDRGVGVVQWDANEPKR